MGRPDNHMCRVTLGAWNPSVISGNVKSKKKKKGVTLSPSPTRLQPPTQVWKGRWLWQSRVDSGQRTHCKRRGRTNGQAMTKRKQQICRAESKKEWEGGKDPGPSSGEAAGCTRVHDEKFLCDLVSLLCGFRAFHDLQGLLLI